MNKRICGCGILVSCAVLLWSRSAAGAGIAIMEQSAETAWYRRLPGGAAAADDASTIFFNPAGLTRLSGSQAIAGMHVLFPRRNSVTKVPPTSPATAAAAVGEGGNAGSTIVIPNFYYSHRFNDRLSAGIGVFSPFGLSTTYDSTWVGRYHAVKSKLISLNINPSLAYRITDNLSVGAGINVQYLKAELSNAIDFGTIFAALGAAGVGAADE